MRRPSPGWMTAMSSMDISRCPDQTVTSFSDFSSAMRKAPPAGDISGRLPRAQARRTEREKKRRGLRERDPGARQPIGGRGVAECLEHGTQESEAEATAP